MDPEHRPGLPGLGVAAGRGTPPRWRGSGRPRGWAATCPSIGSPSTGRLYTRVFGQRDVLALWAQGGATRGAEDFDGSFAVGGYPDSSLFDLTRTNLAVLRGYPDNAFTGRSFLAANAEYRFPLYSPQRGWRSMPLFLRHLRGTVFLDVANAWTGDLRTGRPEDGRGRVPGLRHRRGLHPSLHRRGGAGSGLRRARRHPGVLPPGSVLLARARPGGASRVASRGWPRAWRYLKRPMALRIQIRIAAPATATAQRAMAP